MSIISRLSRSWNPAAPAIREGWRKNGSACKKHPKHIQLEGRKLSTIKFQFIHQNLISFNRFLCFRLSLCSSACVFRRFSAHFIYLSDLIRYAFSLLSFLSLCASTLIFTDILLRRNLSLSLIAWEFDALSWEIFSFIHSSHMYVLCSSSITQISQVLFELKDHWTEKLPAFRSVSQKIYWLCSTSLFFFCDLESWACQVGFVRDSTWCYWTRHNPQSRPSQTLHFF